MQIVCPNCTTAYDVTPAAISAEGRSVRCVRCRSVWFVEPLQAEPEMAAVAPAVAASAVSAPPPPAPSVSAAPSPLPPPPSTPAGGDLDDLAAWGLDDTTPDTPSEGGDDQFINDMLAGAQGAVQVTEAPPLVPTEDWQGLDGEFGQPSAAAGEPARRSRIPIPRLKLRAPSMPTVILILMAIIAGLLGWRSDVVRVMPQTGSLFAAIGLPVNLRGLALEDVKTTKELQDGVPVLVIEGRIVNVSRMMLEVPRIRFAMRNASGNEVYNWTTLPTRPILAPNAEEPFRTRLASPPAEGKDITVRFFSRRDAVGGMR